MRKPKAQLYEFTGGKYQPVITEENVLIEIVERLWFQARIKMWRIRERIPLPGRRWQNLSTPGIPDLIGWIPKERVGAHPLVARPIFLEVKRPGGVRRIAQERFIEEAVKDGCIAFFAESWADVVRELGKHEIKLEAS